MSDIIRLLPDSVANQIAAGEVIQRPASVIKELVENSIDAGATAITIILKDAGRTLIQVIDNGSGMSDTDARLAFERHATSKIAKADDLFALNTMGFRGEALASIAAIAHVDLRTMPHDAQLGTRLIINGSKVESQEPEACAPGSNLMVKNLFFNTPARRKFLKKDSVEMSAIMREFERLALVNIGVDFTLISNDTTLHSLMHGSMKKRICDLFGKNLDKQLIPIETDTSIVSVNGFIGLPENARRRNQLQYFMVNGRNMRHPYFHKAVMQCYEKLIPADAQPNYFINLHVDPETIDVNIHPTKSEIKFENEAPIWQILVAAIKESLGKFNAVPAIDFDSTDSIDIPVFNPSTSAGFTTIPDDNDYNPFAPQSNRNTAPSKTEPRHSGLKASRFNSRSDSFSDWEKLYEGFQNADIPDIDLNVPSDLASTSATGYESVLLNKTHDDLFIPSSITTQPLLPESEPTEAPGLLQLRNKYLIVPSRNGLMIIDRHRAHVKVLYEKYAASTANAVMESQQSLFPETLTLSASQSITLDSMLDDVKKLGFDLSFLGDNVWSINALPAVAAKLNPGDTLMKMIDDVAQGTATPGSTLHHRVLLSMAHAAAVQPGQILSEAEAESLLSDFFSLPDPAYTPDGLPTFFTLDSAEIAKRLS